MQNSSNSSTRMIALASGLTLMLGGIVYLALSPDSDSGPANTDAATSAGDSGFSIFDALSTGDESDQEILTAEFEVLLGQINPRTGELFTDAEAKKVQYLAQKFPENDLIPRPLSESEVQDREARMRANEQQGFQITSGEADEQMIEDYYAFKSKFYTDKVELLKFGLAAEDVEPETFERMERMLNAANTTLTRISERKAASLDIAARRAAGEFDADTANGAAPEDIPLPGDS